MSESNLLENIKYKKRKEKEKEQSTLFDLDEFGKLAQDETLIEVKPATELMKKVAEKATDKGKMSKVFSMKEIEEILEKKSKNQEVSAQEKQILTKVTRANKKWVKNHSVGEFGKIFLYPSYTGKDGAVWYKMLDFSALYFVYYLAERMAMNVNIYEDKDSYIKSNYTASIPDIEDVVTMFLELGGKKVETTVTGIYILTLNNPLTQDDYMGMIKLEGEKRDKLRNLMRPAAMQPVTYAQLISFVTYIGPKIRHLEKRDFFSIGEGMTRAIAQVFKLYYLYSDGLIEKHSAGMRILEQLDLIRGDLAILQELNAWDSLATAAMLGESEMLLRKQVIEDFKIKVGKQ